MAALRAELRLRDGQRQAFSVKIERHLGSLIRGISELNVNVSQLLSELVEREKARGGCAQDEDKENDSEEDEELEEEQNCEVQPPTKRSRT